MSNANTQFWGVVGIGLLSLGAVSSYQGQTVFTAATITTATITTANITTANITTSNTTTENATSLNVSGVAKFADGAVGAPSIAFTSAATTGLYRVSGTRVGMAANGVQVGYWDDTFFHLRPTGTSTTLFQLGTAATASWSYDSTNNVFGSLTSGAKPQSVSKVGTIYFCGLGPNGATPVFMTPNLSLLWGGASAGDAIACVTGSNATEATADKPMFPYLIRPLTMTCGLEDVATDAGVTFTLRSATADVGTDLSCVTGALDGSGHASCSDLHGPGSATYSIAANATIAMSAVAASGNESTSNMFCSITYGWD